MEESRAGEHTMMSYGKYVGAKRRAVTKDRRVSLEFDHEDAKGHEFYVIHQHPNNSARRANANDKVY